MSLEPRAHSLNPAEHGGIIPTMRFYGQTYATSRQRLFVASLAVLWLVAGILPTTHHHESDVAGEPRYDSGLSLSTLQVSQEAEHHEACWLCVKTLSSSGLVKPQTTSADEHVTERIHEARRILPPGTAGRNGASRAPPAA